MHSSAAATSPFVRIVRRATAAALLSALLAACAPSSEGESASSAAAPPESCEFQSPPEVVLSEESRLLQVWVEEARPVLEMPVLPASPSLETFRARISASFDTDPRALLEALAAATVGRDSRNNRLVATGAAGTLRPMNCLEALLLATQTERSVRNGQSMYTHPTEFMSWVLERDGALRIYFYTVDQPGIGGIGIFNEHLERDREAGWILLRNIHNHNFFPDGEILMGGVAPSAADADAYRSAAEHLGLPRATITNGFHSLDMTPTDFTRFAP